MRRLLATLALMSLMTADLVAQPTVAAPPASSQNGLLARQWVKPSLNGQLAGRVIVPTGIAQAREVPDATVVLTDLQGNSLVSRASGSGNFVFNGVKTGIHTVSVRAPGVFASYALHILDARAEVSSGLPSRLDILAVGVDFSVIKSSISRYAPPSSRDRVVIDYAPGGLRPIEYQESIQQGWTTQLVDGGLNGRVFPAGNAHAIDVQSGEVNVFLIHEGEAVDRVVSDVDGTFRFEKAPVGLVGIMALGRAGFATVGVNIVAAENATASLSTKTGETFVALVEQPPTPSLDIEIQLSPLESALPSIETAEIAEQQSETPGEPMFDAFGNPIGPGGAPGAPAGGAPAAGGAPLGAGGGGMAGGGGAGAGGGLGGLGALAGLAGVAAAAGNDGGGDPLITPPPPASPVR